MRPTELLAALAALSPLFLSASATAHDSFAPVRLERRITQVGTISVSSCGLSKSKHQLYLNPLKGTCVAHCPFGYFGVEQTKTCTKCSSAFGAAVKTCDKGGAKSCNSSKNGVPFMLQERQCVCPLGTTLLAGACVTVPVVEPGQTMTTSAATTTTTSHSCTSTSTSMSPTTPGPAPTTPPAQDDAETITVTYDDGGTIAFTTITIPETAPATPTPVEDPSTPTADSSSSTTSSSSSTVITTTSTTSSTTSTTATTAPTPTVRLVPGWSYQGCWRDLAFDGHVLPNDLTSKSAFTVETCLAACAIAGYAICGLEYKGECWGAPGVPRWTEPVDHCNLACKNDSTAICGGSAALTAYVSESIPWVEPVGNEQLVSYSDYAYQGCYADLVVNQQRVLPRQHTNTEGRVESCLDFCASKGASYCGLEYYGECFYALAGESLSSASTPVDESLCRFSCRGAPYEDCGGKPSLSLWKTADRAPPPATVTVY